MSSQQKTFLVTLQEPGKPPSDFIVEAARIEMLDDDRITRLVSADGTIEAVFRTEQIVKIVEAPKANA